MVHSDILGLEGTAFLKEFLLIISICDLRQTLIEMEQFLILHDCKGGS